MSLIDDFASMEPVVGDRNDGSLILGRLSCGYVRPCERSPLAVAQAIPYGRVKKPTQALTCVRALPGRGLTTSALAGTSGMQRMPTAQVQDHRITAPATGSCS